MNNKTIRVLHINTLDYGGAATAVFRLHDALPAEDVFSEVAVMTDKTFGLKNKIIVRPEAEVFTLTDRLKIKLGLKSPHSFSDRLGMETEGFRLGYGFSFPYSLADIMQLPAYREADIIHLHWTGGMLDKPSFFAENSKPVVQTLHDMNPFTSGFHYAAGTDFSTEDLLKTLPDAETKAQKFHNKYLAINKLLYKNLKNYTIIGTCEGMKRLSEKSEVSGHLPHRLIPLGLDTEIFRPGDKTAARRFFDLPENKTIFFFAATDLDVPEKGFRLLAEQIRSLPGRENTVLFAAGLVSDKLKKEFPEVHFSGLIRDDRLLAWALSAADLFINPSLQEAFGQTTIEALSCGLPVVTFPTWGSQDIVKEGVDGYLCEDFRPESMRAAMADFLSGREFNADLIRQRAVQRYAAGVQAKAVSDLYRELLKKDL